MENIHQCFKKRLRSNLVLFTVKFSIKFPAWVNSFLISPIKYPVMFRSTQRFYEDGPYLQVNFRVQSNLERLRKVLFFKNFREIQGFFSESRNKETSEIFLACICFFIFLFYLCFICVLYIMFYFLFYLMTNNEEKIRHCSIR